MDNLQIEILIGAILITIYAHERFNTPPNVRASTTAVRYYVASVIYLMIYLITFYLLTKYPFLLTKLDRRFRWSRRWMPNSNNFYTVSPPFRLRRYV
jgi:hypothetical protein